MQLLNFIITAIVAGSTLASSVAAASAGSHASVRSFSVQNHEHHLNAIRDLDTIYGRKHRNARRNNAHGKKRGSKTCRAPATTVKTPKTSPSHNNSTSTGSIKGLSSKNGLCWANGPWVDITPYKSASWMYSWKATPGNPGEKNFVPDNMMFFPMLWNNGGDRIATWQQYVLNDRNSAANKDKIAMGPNEVNQAGQGIMSPQQGCDLFRKYIMPLKTESGWQIIGPSTTSAPDGKTWMQNFKKTCPDVWNNIDYDAIHYYGTNPDTAISYIDDWYKTFGKPIWITEIACQNFDGSADPSSGQVYNFVKQVTEHVNKADYVLGIAWYAVMQNLNINQLNRLSTSSGSPTDLWHFLTSLF